MKFFKIIALFFFTPLFCCTVLDWQPQVSITTSANAKDLPAICVNEDGYGVAGWEEIIGVLQIAVSNYDPNTNTWSVPVVISNPGNSSDAVQLCCLPNGNAFAVWHQGGAGSTIWASQYIFGVGWTAGTQISGAGAAAAPQITCTDTGEAVVVWQNNTSLDIEYAYFDGSVWNASGPVDTAGSNQRPRICGDGAGGAVAVWVDTGLAVPSRGVQASVFTPPNTWSPAVEVSVGLPPTNLNPNVGCDPNGNAVVAWYNNGGAFTFYGSHFDGSTWSAPTPISNNFFVNGTDTNVCMDDEGNSLIVMVSSDAVTGGTIVEGVYYDASTGTFSPATQLGTVSAGFEFTNAKVCCGPCDGTALWVTDAIDVQIATFDGEAEQWVLPPVTIGTSTGVVSNQRPQLSCDGFGNAYAIWNNSNTIDFALGICPPTIIQGSLSASSVDNRFAFQTECLYQVVWQVPPCVEGIAEFQILQNGQLVQTLPPSARVAYVQREAGVITVRAINTLGVVGSFSVTVNGS